MKNRDEAVPHGWESTETPKKRVVAGMTIGVTSYHHEAIYASETGTYGQAIDQYIRDFDFVNPEAAMISEIRLELDPDAQRALRELVTSKAY